MASKGKRNQRAQDDDDNDFDFETNKGGKGKKGNPGADENAQKIDNHHYDEAVELSDQGSEIQSDSQGGQHNEEGEHQEEEEEEQEPAPRQPEPNMRGQKPQQLQKKPAAPAHDDHEDGEEGEEGEDEDRVPGGYNPNDYNNLNVSQEVKDLFKYIGRYRPQTLELGATLRPFIPDYIPAIGEVDAFLKPGRPDKNSETLGLSSVDEPCLNQSKESTMRLLYNVHRKKQGGEKVIDSISQADKNPKEITRWITDVASIQRHPPSVAYTKAFPEIDNLMQEWPGEVEEALQHLKLPSEELDLSTEEFGKVACSILDIPVYNTTNNKNLVESLHVFFTLYSEFRANQHFQQQPNEQFVYGGQ